MIVKGAVSIKHNRINLLVRVNVRVEHFCIPEDRYHIKNKCSPKAAVWLKFIYIGSTSSFICQLPAGGINVFATAAAQAGIHFVGVE